MNFDEWMKLLDHKLMVRVAERCGESGNDDDGNEGDSVDDLV